MQGDEGSDADILQALTIKENGNAAFLTGDFKEAIRLFTRGLEIDPNNFLLYSNRSAAYAGIKVSILRCFLVQLDESLQPPMI
jgi:Flp pilus assembly protein TadD